MIEKVTDRDIENWRAYYTPLVSTDNMRGFDLFLLNCMDTIDELCAEIAQWENGKIFSKRAADIYEELRANTATPVPEDDDGAIEYHGNIYVPSTLYDAGIEACLVEIKRLRGQEA